MRRIALLDGRSPRFLAAAASGMLLASCFAPFEHDLAAWVALVPLLMALRYSSGPRQAFGLGMVAGLAFWIPSLAWLRRLSETGVSFPVAILAWFSLAACCSIYLAGFAMAASRWLRTCPTENWRRNLGLTVGIPVIWVGFEYLRSTLFTGFPWNAVGVSQYARPLVRQLAEFGGVYAISAIVLVVNTAIALALLKRRGILEIRKYRAHPELLLAALLLGASLMCGQRTLRRLPPCGGALRITAVQPNIPQVKKWSPQWPGMIYGRIHALTQSAVSPGVELIVWPETALPSYVLSDVECFTFVSRLLTNGIPILAGSMDVRPVRGHGRAGAFNAAILFEPDVEAAQVYDKQHLLPFGEYVPLESVIPALSRLAPNWSCEAGSENTVFSLKKRPDVKFSSLICFEDVVARLSRRFVKAGARLLINQTNDAWFDVSCGSKQHMVHCVFRCIENRVPAVRATNTGITCAIDREGNITDIVTPCGVPSEGILAARVAIPPADMRLTLYTRYGDVFALPCGALSLLCAGIAVAEGRKRRRAEKRDDSATKTGGTDNAG